MTRRKPHHPPNQPRPQSSGTGGNSLWLWGTHPVLAALGNEARRCRRLLATAEAQRSHPDLAMFMTERQMKAETVERSAIDSMLPKESVHQGLALLVEPLAESGIDDFGHAAEKRDPAIVVVLDQVTDPHNLGAIMRSAAAFGALGLVVTERNAAPETGTLAKAASGALEKVPLVRAVNLARAMDELKEAGFWIAGLAGDAPSTLAAAKLSGKIALVLGAEGEGLRRLTRERCDLLVKLPQTDAVESLNVSNAAAVALYELVRR